MAEQSIRLTLPKDLVLDQIRAAVRDVLREAIAGVDIYEAIREGAQSTVRTAAREQAASDTPPSPSGGAGGVLGRALVEMSALAADLDAEQLDRVDCEELGDRDVASDRRPP